MAETAVLLCVLMVGFVDDSRDPKLATLPFELRSRIGQLDCRPSTRIEGIRETRLSAPAAGSLFPPHLACRLRPRPATASGCMSSSSKLSLRVRLCDACFPSLQSSGTRLFWTRHGPLRSELALSDTTISGISIKKCKATKTKKRFTELPTTWINPNGTLAVPLDPWIGGLESQPNSTHENATSPIVRTLFY